MIFDDLTVYVRDGWSKVVRRADPGIVSAVRKGNGWEPVWSDPSPDPADEGWVPVRKGVRNSMEGWTYAALNHSALPADYDNRFKARPIDTPRTLYRAVSLGEMADIIRTGAVSGGGNGFHDFDDRPFVFFADTITPKVIWQGEETERSLGHPVRLEAAELEAAYEGYMEELEYEARRKLETAFRTGNEEIILKLSMLESPLDWHTIRDPRSKAFRDALRIGVVPEQEAKRMLGEFQQARDALAEEFKATYRQRYDERQREREAMSFTSAVIETRPIRLGFHFSKRFGGSGMGDEDEYGLFRNQVTADEIVSVRWIKDGSIADITALQGAKSVLERLENEVADFRSMEGQASISP